MVDTKRQYPASVRLWLNILDNNDLFGPVKIGKIPITYVQLDYALSAIPSAVVSLAIGYEAKEPTKSSIINEASEHMRRHAPVTLVVQLVGDAGSDNDGNVIHWDGREHVIFRGRISNIGPKIGNGLTSTLAITHWLGELANTNWIASSFDPGSNASLLRRIGTFSITLNPLGAATVADPTLSLGTIINLKSTIEDLWTKGLKPLFRKIAERDRELAPKVQDRWLKGVGIDPSLKPGILDVIRPNGRAVVALDHMDDTNHIIVPKLNVFSGGSKITETNRQEFLTGISQVIWSPDADGTLWGKILRMAGWMQTAIVPTAESATMIPRVPTLSSHWRTIRRDEQVALDVTGQIPRETRGCVLLPARRLTVLGVEEAGFAYFAGKYDAWQDDAAKGIIADADGLMLIRQAPPWLCDSPSMRAAGPYKSPQTNQKKKALEGADALRAELDAKLADSYALGSAMAKAMYLNEVFRYRTGTLDTNLRFDIAPGSIIRMEAPDERFDIAGYVASMMYGMVAAVRIIVSSQASQCMTKFMLTHVRTDRENEAALDSHPVFGTKWDGSALVVMRAEDLESE